MLLPERARAQKRFSKFCREAWPRQAWPAAVHRKGCIETIHMYYFATVQKDGRTRASLVREGPGSPGDVRKTLRLGATVGGGQCFVTSVLLVIFDHVLVCLFACRPLLSVPAPSGIGSLTQANPSDDALPIGKSRAKERWSVIMVVGGYLCPPLRP
jgi:hypothetical protein